VTATPDRKPFPVRLPPELHQALKARAESLPDITMNDLVIAGVRHVLGEELTVVTGSEMSDAKTELTIAAIEGDSTKLFGIARHYENLGRLNLACLLYWSAAESLARSDPKAAAKELVTTANLARHRRPLAIALLRSALRWNPSNEVAKNRLGQFLYWEGEYESALEHLAPVIGRDNHAKLFHGWAELRLAIAQNNRAGMTRGREEIANALETWAFGERDPKQREGWLRQVAELADLGPEFRQTVLELIEYASDNTSWAVITEDDVASSKRSSAGPELQDTVASEAPLEVR
jgi:tetratricopeptide (TPR) repeat protein